MRLKVTPVRGDAERSRIPPEGRYAVELTPRQTVALEALVRSFMERYHAPGVSLAIAHEGGVRYARGFGYRNVARGDPATPDTVFGVASVSKSFTALAIMQLQDAGLLSVRDPILMHLPEFRLPVADFIHRVTIHHLLTHTSGLPPLSARWFVFARSIAEEGYDAIPVPLDSYPPIDTHAQFMELIAGTAWRPLGPPGRYLSYSSEGYAVLGAVVERVSGLSYAQYVRTHILEPAGLTHTGFDLEVEDKAAPIATFYAPTSQDGTTNMSPVRWWRSPVWLSTGGICSSVLDLIRYLEIYRAGGAAGGARIVSQEAVAEMTRPQAEAGFGQGYGYGFVVESNRHGVPLYGHSGERREASAYVAVVPDRGVTAAVLANVGDMPAYSLCVEALAISIGLPRASAYASGPRPLHRLIAYAGSYQSGGWTIRVEVEGDGLVFHVGDGRYPARPVSQDTFVVKEPELEICARFFSNPRGRPWGVAYGMIIIPRSKDGWTERARRLVRTGFRRLGMRRSAAAFQSVVDMVRARADRTE